MILHAPQVLIIHAFSAKFLAGFPEQVGQVTAQKGDSVKRKDVDENLIQHLHGGKVHAPDKAEDIIILHVEHAAVQDTREGGRKVSSSTVKDDACRNYRQM